MLTKMSESRRSGRSRKKVDYSQFCEVESGTNSDDDFAEPTPPVNKKPKIIKEKTKNEPNIAIVKKKKDERIPLDDKLYERDLELALELSKKSSQESADDLESPDDVKTGEEKEEQKAAIPKPKEEQISIQRIEDKNEDKDSDFDPASNSHSNMLSESSQDDSSDGEGNDSDFDIGEKRTTAAKRKLKSKGKGKGKRKPIDRSPIKPRMNATVTPVHRAGKLTPKGRGNKSRTSIGFTPPAAVSAGSSQSSLLPSPSSSIRKPAWCSPSQGSNPLGGVTLTSPNPLRLGLSRSAHVKPLHPHTK